METGVTDAETSSYAYSGPRKVLLMKTEHVETMCASHFQPSDHSFYLEGAQPSGNRIIRVGSDGQHCS